jgi:hypothetical protein
VNRVKRKRSPGGRYTRAVEGAMQGGLIPLQCLQGSWLGCGKFYVCCARGCSLDSNLHHPELNGMQSNRHLLAAERALCQRYQGWHNLRRVRATSMGDAGSVASVPDVVGEEERAVGKAACSICFLPSAHSEARRSAPKFPLSRTLTWQPQSRI